MNNKENTETPVSGYKMTVNETVTADSSTSQTNWVSGINPSTSRQNIWLANTADSHTCLNQLKNNRIQCEMIGGVTSQYFEIETEG